MEANLFGLLNGLIYSGVYRTLLNVKVNVDEVYLQVLLFGKI